MAGRPFTQAEDLIVLQERANGKSWREIGALINRAKHTVLTRYDTLKAGPNRRYPSKPGRDAPPIKGDPPTRVDDGAHVALLRKLGGFDLRNQW